ncbi:ATP-binding protein [Azonexus sp.]|uniref:ATP-binding protein n=1 Tax=Azonexus sp. TaxID=1872668 RepID=UPI0027B8FBF0|nr:ATP-binding protein [Azonexus sp.]
MLSSIKTPAAPGNRTGALTRLLIGMQIILLVTVVAGTLSHVFQLREEALLRHLDDAKGQARVFEEQLTQTLNLSDLTLQGLPDVLEMPLRNTEKASRQLEQMLVRLLFLRSLSVADEHGLIIASSNRENIGHQIDAKNFHPLHEGPEVANFMRIGTPWRGRDIADGSPTNTENPAPADSLSFIPVVREVIVEGQRLRFIAALNPDYFINQFLHHVAPELTEVEIIDYQGIATLSTRQDLAPGSRHLADAMLDSMREHEIGSLGEYGAYRQEMLTAYRASRNYPLFVLIHVDRERALANWQTETRDTLILIGLALSVTLLLSSLLIQRVRRGLLDEARLHHERQLAAQVFENSTSGIMVTDAERRILAVNPELIEVSGFSRAELLGQTPRLLNSGRHPPAFYQNMWARIASDDIWRGEITNRRKDGRLIEEWLTISAVRDKQNQVVNYLGVFEDITEQRLQALRLKRQLAALRALNEIATVNGLDPRETLRQALLLASRHLHLEYGIISYIDQSSSTYRIEVQVSPDNTLHDRQEFPLGSTFCSTIVERDSLFMLVNAADSEYRDHPCFKEFQLASYLGAPIRIDGSLYGTINFSSHTGRDHDFDPSDIEFIQLLARWAGGFLERMRALEQLDKARQAAEAASVAKGSFLANMSHEIRTPMNGVIGMAELLLTTPLTAEQRDFAETIRHSADSLLSLINDVLDFSKVEAGKLHLECISFSPADVLHDTIALLRHAASLKPLTLNGEIAPDVPQQVIGDPSRLRQVLINLVGNAVKFTEAGSVCIEFSSQPIAGSDRSTWLCIRVSDTGIGMAPDVLAGLFSPFFQGDASTTRQFGGTGLGLSICKRLTELMGGKISVESTPGCGSVFQIELPVGIDNCASAETSINESALTLPEGTQVLLVEDNLVNQKVAAALLNKLGCVHVIADNGAEALRLLGEQQFDVVLMDCQMPVMDGFEATRRLRAGQAGDAMRTVPVIAMTANAMQGDREECLACGMDDYLAKPVNNATLKAALARWTHRR